MSINTEINRLLNFAIQQGLMTTEDIFYSANRLIDLLKVHEFVPEKIDVERTELICAVKF